MRRMVLIATIGALLQLAPAHADADVVELPVAFEVINQNRSITSTLCQGDGKNFSVPVHHQE